MTVEIVTPERTLIEQAIAESLVEDRPETLDYTKIDPRVLAGARFLDQQLPGWADQINLTRFDLNSGESCVIGQLHNGNYRLGCIELFGNEDDAREELYGFVGNDFGANDDNPDWSRQCKDDWAKLDRDWMTVIADRQKNA